jgi:hypothetical protein
MSVVLWDGAFGSAYRDVAEKHTCGFYPLDEEEVRDQ